MLKQSLLDEVFEKIRLARIERQQMLSDNVAAVKKLRNDVRKHRAEVQRHLQQESRVIRRSLKRFVERNQIATQRLLVNANAARIRYRMRLRFENMSATGQRKRSVQAILRNNASKRRLGEMHRQRITATRLASLQVMVGTIFKRNLVSR